MTRALFAPLLLVFALGAPGFQGLSAQLEVRSSDGTVTVQAHGAPVCDVLERLSRETGLKVVYEGARPSQRVTASFRGVSEIDALNRLLEGLGLNYALQTDASGQRPVLLVVAGSMPVKGPAASAARAPGPTPNAPVSAGEAEQPWSEPQPEPAELAEDPAAAGGGLPMDSQGGTFGVPGPGGVFGGQEPAAAAPSAPGIPTANPWDRSLPSSAVPPQPSFPAQPSMPTPYFPPPASNPSP